MVVQILMIVVVSQGCVFSNDIPHKTDAEMIQHFHENKAGFESLLEMVREDQQKVGDRLFRIDHDWNEPNDLDSYGVGPERISEYRRLFKELGVPRGFYAYDQDTYLFVASSVGIAVSGSSKGYVWSGKPLERIINSDLDEFQRSKRQHFLCRPIEGNWYLERSD